MTERKIGAVSYFNTLPLVHALDQLAPEYQVVFDLPSRLCHRLASRELDVALIPVVEAVGRSNWTRISDACIACHGPVWSVKLLSRLPWPRVQTLALDEGSRTSVVLAHILLAEQFGAVPECSNLSIEENYRNVETDAVLVIGDRAMQPDTEGFPFVLDLGQAWRDWTGLPFVFAVWAAHDRADHNRLALSLTAARDRGLEKAASIARMKGPEFGLTPAQAERYLTQHLHFKFGREERLGLALFLEKAVQHGLLASDVQATHELVGSR